jgi:ribosome-associated protein
MTYPLSDLHKQMITLLEDKKACHIKLVDMEQKSDICSYQLICSALNERHAQALCDTLEGGIKKDFDLKPKVIEGKSEGRWILLDYSSDIIHIFVKDIRSYYAFDALCDNKKILFESREDE